MGWKVILDFWTIWEKVIFGSIRRLLLEICARCNFDRHLNLLRFGKKKVFYLSGVANAILEIFHALDHCFVDHFAFLEHAFFVPELKQLLNDCFLFLANHLSNNSNKVDGKLQSINVRRSRIVAKQQFHHFGNFWLKKYILKRRTSSSYFVAICEETRVFIAENLVANFDQSS